MDADQLIDHLLDAFDRVAATAAPTGEQTSYSS
jgi:hypothetical protein